MKILIKVNKFNEQKLKFLEEKSEVFYLRNSENILKLFLKVLKFKKEKDIQIVILDINNLILKLVIKYILRLPILFFNKDNIDNIEKLELTLQHMIAYKRQKDIPVLMYHRVIEQEEEKGYYDTYVTKENFEKQMKYLREQNYEVLTFQDIDKRGYINRFDRDKKYVIITFDDGYKDNYKNVFPIIKKYKIKIVLFLVTNSIYNEWDVQAEGRPKEKKFNLMNSDEIQEMYDSGLVEIGNHTTTHLDMPNYNELELKEDLLISTKKLEKLIKNKVISFAYPWGNNNAVCRKVLKDMGFKFAVSTVSGSSCFSDDLYEIKRVGVYSKDSIEKFKEKISGNYTFMRENRANRKRIRNKLRSFFGLGTK